MAKKLTKAQIAKNPTKAINSGKMKMKKQEVPLSGIGKAAARAVGKAIVNVTTGKYAARNYVESSIRASAKKTAAKTAKAEAKANARGLKAAQGKSLAPKKYKPDTEGRKQVKRFAAPLEKANGKKTSMRMGAQAVDAGRSSMKIKAAPKNRSK